MSETSAFSAATADYLKRFLGAPERPEGTMSFDELGGFLFALASVPEVIPPTEWLPVVFRDGDAAYGNAGAQPFLDALLAFHDWTIAEVNEGRCSLPPGCEAEADPMANFGVEGALGRWSRGFAAGHRFMADWWPSDLSPEQAEDLSAVLILLSFFSSREFAEGYRKHMERNARTTEELAAHVITMLPEARRVYAELGKTVALVSSDEPQGPARSDKTGRNDPCPCGSGKKYKKCCGA
jgi:uncharacterized protein